MDAVETILDAIPEIATILDASGTIVSINNLWMEFGTRNDLKSEYEFLGTNYLAVTRQATSPSADYVAEKLSEILAGERGAFSVDYPCHAPDETRWFRVHAQTFEISEECYILVVHEEITTDLTAQVLPDPIFETLVQGLRGASVDPDTAALSSSAALIDPAAHFDTRTAPNGSFRTALERLLRTAYDVGYEIGGLYAYRNEPPYPDWQVIIDDVEKPNRFEFDE